MIYFSQHEQFERSGASGDAPWLRSLRKEALKRFGEVGFPTTRDEGWRSTNVAPLAKVPFKLAPAGGNGLTAGALGHYLFGEMACCNLIFVNGRFSKTLSSLHEPPAGVKVGSLAAALQTDGAVIESHLGQYARWQSSAFTALNTAFIADGAFVYIPDRAVIQQVIHLVYVSTAPHGATMSHPRNLILVGSESQVRLVESYVGLRDDVYFTNAVTEIAAGDNSMIEHYKLQRESEQCYHVATMQTQLGASSALSAHTVLLGGSLVRNDTEVVLNGEGADCSLSGLYVTRGTQHMDNHTSIDHAEPHCNSRQLYKGVLDDRSSGVFTGRIIVRPDAQKTDARQSNRNLLLSDNAVVDSKPQLEIHANDVKCTHGATIGKLDEEALFYLRSRGLSEPCARTLLTYAFASEVVNMMKIKPMQCQIDLVLLNRLAREGKTGEAS